MTKVMFRHGDTIGFQEVLAHIQELEPGLKKERVKAKAKVLYINLFTGARQGHLDLDFVCSNGHSIKTCRCTGSEFRGEWFLDLNPADIAAAWRLGVGSLVNLKQAQIDHFQVQTAGHIRDFVSYISKRSRR